MKLSPMRFKTYTWPHNPRVYTMDYGRKMAAHKLPFGGCQLEDLGRTYRIMEGEGEFVGPEAYREFGKLAAVFYQSGPGQLIHPLWQAAQAHFVSLRLMEEPRPDYVRYAFTFWEDGGQVSAPKPAPGGNGGGSRPLPGGKKYHWVKRGETLYLIARKYGTTVERIMELNPQLKNPNRLSVGQAVRVK